LIVTVVGCGEAFDERLPNTSVLVRTESAVMLLDCGYTVPPHVWRAESDPNTIDLVYLSHAHADHYFGLPALLGRMWEDGRTKPLVLMAQQEVLHAAEQLLEMGYRDLRRRFRFDLQPCPVSEVREHAAFDCLFRFAATRHSSRNFSIRIDSARSALCYSGDGALTAASRELIRGVALWIQETYSFEPSEVHADIEDVLNSATAAGVKRLAMVHVSRGARRERARLFEAMLSAPVLCALPEPGSMFLL
jgi:ribonuclease BN (tRNA processing enzyme)